MKKKARTGGARIAPIVQIVLICLISYVGLFAILLSGITPEQYDIQVGAPAPIQILATKDVLDTVTTDALREAAAAAVEPSYKSADPTVLADVMADLGKRFDALRTLRTNLSEIDISLMDDTDLSRMNTVDGLSLNRDQMITLKETSDETFEEALTSAANEVREILRSTLPEGQESNAVKSLRADLSRSYSAQLSEIISEATRGCLRPTMLIDEQITEENRARARDSVEPEMCVKGEVIVREGDIVTLAQYTMISSMGMLAENSFDVQLFLGVAMLVLLVMAALGLYLYRFHRDLLFNPKMMILLNLILLLVMGLSLVLREVNVYLMPVSLGLLLTALLIDSRLAIAVNFALALLTAALGTAGSPMFSLALMSLLSGPIIAVLFGRSMLRTTTLLAGLLIAVSNFLVTLSVGLFNSAEVNTELINALWAAASGVVSAVLCIGAQPLMEWLFNLATSTKLIELSNPNQPLLRRLLLEASGTYHHSIIVANLAEAGCSAIGANGLLARVGAYYHDIGKLKRPMYFKENQMGDNPHDRTDPRVSAAILTAHPRDGAQLAQKARIPQPVIDIIRQHHGDTPTIYFYDKARKLYGDDIDISAFRYEGPCPTSREAAVVMLADGIEAATRAMPNPDPEKIDALIHKLVRQRQTDGQLDRSPLTFSDLDKICSAFSTVLTGAFHERIEYPTVNIPPRSEAAESVAQPPKAEAPKAPAEVPAQPEEAPTQPVQPDEPQPESPAAPAVALSEAPAQPAAEPADRPAEPTPVRTPMSPGAPVPPAEQKGASAGGH